MWEERLRASVFCLPEKPLASFPLHLLDQNHMSSPRSVTEKKEWRNKNWLRTTLTQFWKQSTIRILFSEDEAGLALGWVTSIGPSVALEVFHSVNNTASNSLLHKDFPTFKMVSWNSLVVPWLRVYLLMKGAEVLIPRQGRYHMPQSSCAYAPQLLKPACPRAELCHKRSHCNGKSRSSPCSKQPEEACTVTKIQRCKKKKIKKPSILKIKKNKVVSLVRWLDTHTYTNAHIQIHAPQCSLKRHVLSCELRLEALSQRITCVSVPWNCALPLASCHRSLS